MCRKEFERISLISKDTTSYETPSFHKIEMIIADTTI